MKYAVVTNTGTDAGDMQKHQVKYMGKTSECALMNPYGHLGKPPLGSLAIVESMSGDEANKVSIANAVKTRKRNLKDGETGTQNHMTGTIVFLDSEGNLVIDVTNDQKITVKGDANLTVGGNVSITVSGTATVNVAGNTDITTPTMTLNGNMQVNGTIDCSSTVTAITDVIGGGKSLLTHTHVGSPTAPTGGISNTGAPV